MPTFNLTKGNIARLRAKFQELNQLRDDVRKNMADYVADYRQFEGTPQDRREYLEEEYGRRIRRITHLIFDEDKKILWHIQDIAILLRRDASSISRTILKIERTGGWSYRLLNLQHDVKSANNNVIHVYDEEIFDLIIDFYEEEYLLRFTEPRRGAKDNAPDEKEVRRFWNYLKTELQIENSHVVSEEEELSELPPMNWGDVLLLIWQKIFNIRTLTISPIILGIGLKLSHLLPGITPYMMLLSFIIFTFCSIFLRFRRGRTVFISSIGAIALLFALSWIAGLSPNGTIMLEEKEHELGLKPVLWRGPRLNFQITSDFYDNIKKIFCRISPDIEYHLTGFNNFQYPDLLIEPEQQEGIMTLDLKYIDTSNKEYGPYRFTFDMEKERFNLSKNFILNDQSEWLSLQRFFGTDLVEAKVCINTKYADNVIKFVVYGINTDKPNIIIPFPKQMSNDSVIIFRKNDNEVQYVTSYLVFDDNTSSDIRRSEY